MRFCNDLKPLFKIRDNANNIKKKLLMLKLAELFQTLDDMVVNMAPLIFRVNGEVYLLSPW